MGAETKKGIVFIILSIIIFSGCVPAAPPGPVSEPTEEPTALPSPTPEPTTPPTATAKPAPIPDAAMAWHGEWIVWFGPDEIETLLFIQQEGKELSTMIYDISGTISEDGRTLTGEISEMGFTGKVKAALLENGTQFTGNVSGLFPICGARPGEPKPDPCRGP